MTCVILEWREDGELFLVKEMKKGVSSGWRWTEIEGHRRLKDVGEHEYNLLLWNVHRSLPLGLFTNEWD